MADRKSFLIRIDGKLLEALRRWADDDLRSLNGQVEFVLRRALREAGRTPETRNVSQIPPVDPTEGPSDNRQS